MNFQMTMPVGTYVRGEPMTQRYRRGWGLVMLWSLLITVPLAAQRVPALDLDQAILDGMRRWEIPGLAIALVKDDSVVFAKGYGVREVGTAARVDERTLFAIGSASKAVTAAAVAMLVDEGRLRWDDRVGSHLPGLQLYDPYVTRELTVRDLLTHRSGLARGDLLWYAGGFDRSEVLRRIRYLEPSWSFRSRFGYQNVMFLAAGELVAALSGQSWGNFVTDRIFTPLGMASSTTSITALAAVANVAVPHAKIDERVQPVPWRNIDNIAPAGSVNSNVVDMAKWIRLQLAYGTRYGQQLISPESVREMMTPQSIVRLEGAWALTNPASRFLTYGLGWFVQDFRGRKLVQHGGNIDGMSAQVGLLPEENIGLVILTNMNGSLFPIALMYHVFDLMLGISDRDWSDELFQAVTTLETQQAEAWQAIVASRASGTTPSLPLPDYAGSYVDSLYGVVEVTLADAGLVAQLGSAFVGDLEHWHYDTFRARWRDRLLGEALLRFILDERGRVKELDVQNVGVFGRVDPGPDPQAAGESGKRRDPERF